MSELIKSTAVARINNVDIIVIENGEKRVAVKPICEALGIAHQSQIERLKSDPILSSVVTLSITTGSDKKEYKMVCLPLKYVFGWLFTINPKNVKEEAREAVAKYRAKCYDVLYDYFSEYADFVEIRSLAIDKQLEKYQEYQAGFRDAKQKMEESKSLLNKTRSQTFESYKANKDQFKLDFLSEE
jgi:hypothetical protein